MKKCYFIIWILIVSNTVVSQNNSGLEYFPQEQLIHPDCVSETDKNNCLKSILEDEIAGLLNKKVKSFSLENDTLRVTLGFSIDDKGFINPEYFQNSISHKKVRKKIKDGFKAILLNLPPFDIRNRKPAPYRSIHFLKYSFLKKQKKHSF